MKLTAARADRYHQAILTRDPRFDGKFFFGVKTTGIFCRPICPARPKRQNIEFFADARAASRAGYRPCLRCRPEVAPFSAAWKGKSAIVQRAVRLIHTSKSSPEGEEAFAAQFGVSARHLRRVCVAEIGRTPHQLALENRLSQARVLVEEARLPITQIAFASGFASVRTFNGAFKKRFKRSPREWRRGQR